MHAFFFRFSRWCSPEDRSSEAVFKIKMYQLVKILQYQPFCKNLLYENMLGLLNVSAQ